ncbi:phosphotransferase enzyme family protein [Peribacillus frigoritolerans]|uniref:phosphotransferase enzyme family protein n=1 Tax=Peribacillus frigoritolerans TaxID=450367 RepID=UPI002570129B|nr:aminoglycoside phosphotransferase family protein [Peribacillus frigoritolerans]
MDIIGEGSTAITYSYGKDKAVKMYRYDSTNIHYEFEVNRYLTECGISVPKAYEIVTIDGKEGIVFEKAAGNPLTSEMMKSPKAAIRSLKMMARLHASIHEKSAESLKTQKSSIEMKIHACSLPDAEKTAILDHLVCLSSGKQLCHADFHPDNILISDGNPVVIDWADAVCGHPMADLARTILILRFGGLKTNDAIMGFIRKWMCKLYIREYKKYRSFTAEELYEWELPLAAARLSESIPPHEKQKLHAIIRSYLKK